MQIKMEKGSTLSRLFIWGCVVLCACIFTTNMFAAAANNKPKPLPANKAFALSYTVKEPNEVHANWQIAPGYYLYRDRMHIVTVPESKITVNYPKGETKRDIKQKPYEIYSGNLSVPVILPPNTHKVQLSIEYQGCSERGFCYPPMHKNISLDLSTTEGPAVTNTPAAPLSLGELLTDQNGVKSLFYSEHFGILLSFFVGLGLLLAFTPCVFPMIPILTGIIVGQKGVTTRKAFMLSLTYVLGSAITYAMAGVLAASMGSSLQVWLQKPWIIGVASGFFVLLAMSLFGFYEMRLPNRVHNMVHGLSNKQQSGTYIGVFFMGVLSTLIVSPCVTAPLVGVLMYIGQTGDLVLGGSALFAMGIGMGIPLLIIGMSAGKWLPKSGAWMEAVKKFFGLLMLGMAIWLVSRIISPFVTHILWGCLLIGIAAFFALYLPRLHGRHKFNRSLGFIVGFSGMLVMFGVGVPTSMTQWLAPGSALHSSIEASPNFKIVHNVSDFDQQLALARAANQPAILDFYADWCDSCVAMDRNVFNSSDVQRNMNNYVLLRVDLSGNTAADEDLLKHFDVIAPPTVLFFDSSGREMNSQRIVGEVNAKEFLSRLTNLRNEMALSD